MQIFDYLREIVNPEIKEKHGPFKLGEQKRSVIDNAKAEKYLHWKPKKCLLDGLKEICAYFRQQTGK